MRWQDLEQELLAVPGVQEEIERLYPYEAVSLEIAKLRGSLEMTQTEFGQLVGIPQSTVARLESGRQNPSVRMLKRIAAATDTELHIEFHRPKKERRRRAAAPSGVASSGSNAPAGEPLAASGAND